MPEGKVESLFWGTPGKYVHVGLDENRPWFSTPPEKALNLTLSIFGRYRFGARGSINKTTPKIRFKSCGTFPAKAIFGKLERGGLRTFFGTFKNMDVFEEPTGMYSRRVPKNVLDLTLRHQSAGYKARFKKEKAKTKKAASE